MLLRLRGIYSHRIGLIAAPRRSTRLGPPPLPVSYLFYHSIWPFHTYLFYPQSMPFLFFPPGLSICCPWQLTPRSRHSMDLYENYIIYLILLVDGGVLLGLRGGSRGHRIVLAAGPQGVSKTLLLIHCYSPGLWTQE